MVTAWAAVTVIAFEAALVALPAALVAMVLTVIALPTWAAAVVRLAPVAPLIAVPARYHCRVIAGAGLNLLKNFVAAGLRSYDTARNQPHLPGTSRLSAYLHFGQLGPHTIAQAVREADAPQEAKDVYLEELIVRRELAINYVARNPRYDQLAGCHEWARKSLIMLAYAQYEARDYDECINSAKRYVSLHPGSPDAAYAQYLIAASHYDQIPDVSRDQGRTEKAINALEEVVRKYPTSEYATSAKAKLEGARDQLAGKEMDVGRYYMDKRDFTAAINRFKTVVTRYQTTRHVEEALFRLTEAYLAIGIVGEAQTAAAVLGHNFPDSRWYKEAYNLVKSGGVEPSENKGSYISRAFKKMGLG